MVRVHLSPPQTGTKVTVKAESKGSGTERGSGEQMREAIQCTKEAVLKRKHLEN